MIEVIYPYQTPAIEIFDFLVLTFCEMALIWFFMPKKPIKQTFPMILAINLIKVGAFSLITPILYPSNYTFYYNSLIEITILIVIGTIFSTIVYEREQVDLSRNQSSSIAFRVTSLSTLIWSTLRTFQPSPIYFLAETSGWRLPDSMTLLYQPFLSSNILLFVALVTGLLMIFIRYNKKNLLAHPSTP
ncbi:MAG: hypothetical protein ACXADY_14400 [Candidatus Hodarchaeales archaeon]